MKVNIKYFGQLAEISKREEESFILQGDNVAGIIAEVHAKYPALKDIHFMVAVNQTVCEESHLINANDEIALLPQFAGG
jgi:molybdopterin synthase sulfur carrier subunit